jgi:DNA-binding winged helix-turn-helix (wHTH) protein
MATLHAAPVFDAGSWAFTLRLPSLRSAPARIDWSPHLFEQRRREQDESALSSPSDLTFGPFHLLPGARTLLRDGQVVECGSRAFDLLHILLLSPGKVVSKEEIIRHVWPTTCVDESNLRFQMASLRKALGVYRDAIKTIPGRGYFLASEWRAPEQATE